MHRYNVIMALALLNAKEWGFKGPTVSLQQVCPIQIPFVFQKSQHAPARRRP
jgi:hypothetical protein